MASIVLVPGGYHGGWWFRPILQRLRAAGHEPYAATPTGLGDRRHLAGSAINLDTHITDVVGLIECEQLDDVVLCGHSYGGMIITGVADRIPDRLKALVYLDAQVPDDGESLWTLTTPAERDRLAEMATEDGTATRAPERLDDRTAPHPLASFFQPIRLTRDPPAAIDRTFVWCEGWENSPLKPMHDRVKDRPDWDVRTWPIGHDIVGQGEDRVADLLDEVATRTS